MPGLSFERYEVERLHSIAHLFPRSLGRRGLYVLEFTNGDAYAGKATSVVDRFSAHRRRWDDIAAIRFQRLPGVQDLDGPERQLIHDVGSRGPVRNIRDAVIPEGFETDLDVEITQDEQRAWLNDEDSQLSDITTRTDDRELRASRLGGYERLRAHPRFDDLVAMLQVYTSLCIPRPKATELTFWSLSASPSTNRRYWPRLAAISINSMETLVIGHFKGDPERLWGFVNVSRKRARLPRVTWLERSTPWMNPEGSRRYEASGPDQVAVAFHDPLELVKRLTDDANLVAAARELNLRVMRKGPTLQWRFHCFALADDVLDASARREARTAGSLS